MAQRTGQLDDLSIILPDGCTAERQINLIRRLNPFLAINGEISLQSREHAVALYTSWKFYDVRGPVRRFPETLTKYVPCPEQMAWLLADIRRHTPSVNGRPNLFTANLKGLGVHKLSDIDQLLETWRSTQWSTKRIEGLNGVT